MPSGRASASSARTLTRCSSTPMAETLVNPPGSTTVTLARRLPSPPQCSMRARAPGVTATASVESSSISISRSFGSPTSMIGVDAATARAFSSITDRTYPSTGARMGTVSPWLGVAALVRAARAAPASCSATCRANVAACAPRSSTRTWFSVRSHSWRATAPLSSSESMRRSSVRARSRLASVRLASASLALTAASAASIRARASALDLGFRKVAGSGVSSASTVFPASMRAPARSPTRCR
ncbi:hypothetical protein DSECCO2_655940 [anaerobic digester metagenome]